MDLGENNFVRFHWGNYPIILTVLIVSGLIFACYKMINSSNPIGGCFLSLICVVLFGYFAIQTPLYLESTKDKIKIKLLVKCIYIDKKNIISIERVNFDDLKVSYRAGGSGGFFGYTGRFKSLTINTFYMYATQLDNLILIKTPNKNYVISYFCKNE